MPIEIVLGAHLGDLRYAPEQTILAHRRDLDLPESSFDAFAAGLNELLSGMARDCSDYVLAPNGAQFFFLLLVKKPTLGLDFNQSVTLPVTRLLSVPIAQQFHDAAMKIAAQLADLGEPRWMERGDPRRPKHLALN